MNGAATIGIPDAGWKLHGRQHMQLGDVLMVPWRSAHGGLRWLSLAIVGACMLGAVAAGLFTQTPRWWLASTAIYGIGAIYAWTFWLPGSLLLAIDARKLRLPGMQRAAHASLLLYGLLTTALPTLALGAFGADARPVMLLTALAAAGGLAFMLLPRWCAMVFGFLPALATSAAHFFQLPPWSDPRWLLWGTSMLAALLIVDVLRWRQLLHSDTDNELGFGSALVMQFRRRGAMNGWSGLQQMDSGQMIRQRPDWMQPRADLRRTGPRFTVRTLRVALGGWYMPKTLAGHLRAAAPVLLPILLLIPLMALMSAADHRDGTVQATLAGIGAGLGWTVMFGGLVFTAMTTVLVRQRWKRSNAELPLLALMPGLGNARQLRRDLLRAVFTLPAVAQTLLLVTVLVAATAAHLGGLAVLLVALPQLAAFAAMASQVLCTLGGRRLSTLGECLVYIPVLVLFVLSTCIPASTLGRHPWPAATLAESWLLAAWTALALVLAWLGLRGWRGLQARPHPFMPN